MKLLNKVVLITGASSGIGRETAHQAAREGANLVIVARRKEQLRELADEIKKDYNVNILMICADLSQSTQIERVVAKTKQHCGRIDYLVNSAGFGEFKPALEFTYGEIEAMFKINTFAMMYLSQLVAQVMIEQREGQIVFISSISGKLSTPSSSVYSATKSAIIGYADSLRLELRRFGIGITTINPGPVKTPFFSHSDELGSYYQRIEQFALETDYVANKVIQAMTHNAREITIPFALKMAAFVSPLVPHISDFLKEHLFNFKEEIS
ncbi:SDR family NAD(P)-dependent oxidoreductase [Fundicoccus sp. Sow4_D5]|uniref:SDR family NAD(P)-dependent oxidoreductase n=1 Tax=unclassified Fundicoccus TaxID=2761543 RepID=UPI003F928603